MESDSATPAPQRGFERVEAIVKIFTGLSLVVGIAVGIWGPGGLHESARKRKLDSLSPIKAMVEEDYDRKRLIVGLNWKQLEKEVCEGLSAKRTGHDVYFAETGALRKLSRITEHYERMGAMVVLDYIQFDLIFEVISFPDDFWRRLSRVRGVLAGNWRSQLFADRSLPDLWGNFYLCERFQHERAKFNSPTIDCRQETKEATPCLDSFPAQALPPSPDWWQRISW